MADRRTNDRWRTASMTLLFVAACSVGADDRVHFFENKIRPLLIEHCAKCHGEKKEEMGLRLDSVAGLIKGSDEGPVLNRKDLLASKLLKAIRHEGDLQMPPNAKLPDTMINDITSWLEQGAALPSESANSKSVDAKSHWSFQPIKKPPVPKLSASLPAQPASNQPANQADAKTLELRRQAWIAGNNPIDQFILARLDTANLAPSAPASPRALLRRIHFVLSGLPPTAAELQAFEKDHSPAAIAKVVDRLLADPAYGERWGRHWLDIARYGDNRGYVDDNRSDREYHVAWTYRDWVIDALNRDLPYDQFIKQQLAADLLTNQPNDPSLAALGLLTVGRRFLNDIRLVHDDRIDVITRGMLGMSVTCARCHDHKYDPIPSADYYSLYGIFDSTIEPGEATVIGASPKTPAGNEYAARRKELEDAVAQVIKGRPEKDWSADDKKRIDDLRNQLRKLNLTHPGAPPRALTVADSPSPHDVHVAIRGNFGRPGPIAPRRFLSAISPANAPRYSKGSGRLELAEAMVAPSNPLTARVAVNRVWQMHFRTGIVRTPGDFGTRGDPPTHPELLDWLAAQFIEQGWSLKKLHRLILTSQTFQQASDDSVAGFAKDADNALLWRYNRRRLDFEAFRDSVLYVAGNLDRTMGGPGLAINSSARVNRRTVYSRIDRQNLEPVFRTWDFAGPNVATVERFETLVPQQGLYLLNSPFVMDQSTSIADRFSGSTSNDAVIEQTFNQVLGRAPTPDEVKLARQLLGAETPSGEAASTPSTQAWEYGFGQYHPSTKRVTFTRFDVVRDGVWRPGVEFPHPEFAYVSLNRSGGHPGIKGEFSTIIRWQAPDAVTINIEGRLNHSQPNGDGVIATIVSSKRGQLAQWKAKSSKQRTQLKQVQVDADEHIYFIVSPGESDNSDTYEWSPAIEITAQRGTGMLMRRRFRYSDEFVEQLTLPLTPRAQLAQALFMTNEFLFID